MNSLNEKISKVCGDILITCKNISSMSKPVIYDSNVIFTIRDISGSSIEIKIGVQQLSKAHDYLLDNLIIETMMEYHLL